MRILLPVYALPDARLIVDFVGNYHWPADTSFKIIHVLGSIDTETAAIEVDRQAEKLVDEIRDLLHELLPGAPIENEVIPGSPVYEIVTAAAKWKADMIVLGYRTLRDIKSALAGSVAKGVVMQAPCSVAIIRPSQDEVSPAGESSTAEALRPVPVS